MFSSKKILYFIILSLLVFCAINGIDYRSNLYSVVDETHGEMIDFTDSGFFAVSDHGDSISIVAKLDDEDGASEEYVEEDMNISPDQPDDQQNTEPDEGGDLTIDNNTTAQSETPTNNGQQTTTQQSDYVQPEFTTTANDQPQMTQGQQPTQTQQQVQQTQPEFTTAYTTTTQYIPPLTTTTTTTTTPPPTTTTEYVYTDNGSIHFVYSQVTIYAGASTTIDVSFPFGSQQRATFATKDSSTATVRNYDDTTVLVTGVNVGSTWIQATNSAGETAYCKVVVTDFAGEVLRLTNIERANYGLAPLGPGNNYVQKAANIRLSEAMQSFSHTRPNGKKFSSVALEIGLTYRYIGENLACGQTTPQQVVEEWMASPTHRANILNENYLTLCVAYGVGDDGYPYWVQIFHTA